MGSLTTMGFVHTAISVAALSAGVVDLARTGAVSPRTGAGKAYVALTAATCFTGFFIFQHGGFGKPHALGIVTLLVLAVALLGDFDRLGRLSTYFGVVGMSLTLFLHSIPGLTETFTRLPADAPVFVSPEDPALQKAVGLVFVVFLIGAALQVRRLRAQRRGLPAYLARSENTARPQ